MRLLPVLVLGLAAAERIERRQAGQRQLLSSASDGNGSGLEGNEDPSAAKRKYVQEKMAIEREVVAPFVAKAKTIPAAYTQGKQKLAFIFLTMRELQWPELWDRFFEDAPLEDYSIYVHQAAVKPGDFPMPLPLFRWGANPVPWVRTAWCALFGVEVAALFEALKDPTNSQFVFVSDSTVPLKSFAYVHKELMEVAPQSSKVCLAEPAGFSKVKPEMLKQEAKGGCFFRDFLRNINPRTLKHHQWLTLARRHAEAVVVHAEAALDIYETAWVQAGPDLDMGEGCSDEAVPVIALLASLEAAGRSSGNTWTDLTRLGVEQECLTYVRWRNCFRGTDLDLSGWVKDLGKLALNPLELHNMIFQGNFDFMKSNLKRELNGFPHLFSNITQTYLSQMVTQGFMFARKFDTGIKVHMNGNDKAPGVLNFVGLGAAQSNEYLPLEEVLPKMWAEVEEDKARRSTWSHLEAAGKPSPLGRP